VIGGKKKYINIFGSFTEPFNYNHYVWSTCLSKQWCKQLWIWIWWIFVSPRWVS